MKTRFASKALGGAMLALAVAVAGLHGTPAQAAISGNSLAAPPMQSVVAFQNLWSRTDFPVAQGVVSRGYVWGPTALVTRSEPYVESPGQQRLVQYWDKARMEINNPYSNPNDPFYVTNGRLVYEMVGGLIQMGNNNFTPKAPSEEPVAGDTRAVNPDAPSYAAFRGRTSIFPGESQWADVTNNPIVTYIDYRGVVGRVDYLAGYGAKYGHYVPETKHNIADKFWTYLNQQGTVFKNGAYVTEPLFNWVAVTGYPISEPHWITARVGGLPYAVLVQLFERRTLTWTPLFPAAFQLQMGNVGQHYLAWRYGP